MILFLILISLAALLQSTIINLNLCLMTVIAVAFLRKDGTDLYIAFFGGLILGLLSGVNIGFYPIIFLLSAKIVHLYKQLPISGNVFFTIPVTLILLLMLLLAQQIILRQTPNYFNIPLETIIFFLIFFLAQFFENRFAQPTDIRLRLK